MQQRTEEWLREKAGKFSASEIYKLCGVKGLGKVGDEYILKKVAETLAETCEVPADSYAIRHGIELEPEAREYYSRATGYNVLEDGFKNLNDDCGCSPDGIIPELKKGIEIKCPLTLTGHVRHLLLNSAEDLKNEKPEYYWQCLLNMLVYDYDTWDFVSYHKDFKGADKMSVLEIKRINVEKDIKFLKERIVLAIIEKHRLIAILKGEVKEETKPEIIEEKNLSKSELINMRKKELLDKIDIVCKQKEIGIDDLNKFIKREMKNDALEWQHLGLKELQFIYEQLMQTILDFKL